MSNKKETPEQTITDISIYVAALSTTYRPASTPAEATHFSLPPRLSMPFVASTPLPRSAPSKCSPPLSTQGSTSATAPARTA